MHINNDSVKRRWEHFPSKYNFCGCLRRMTGAAPPQCLQCGPADFLQCLATATDKGQHLFSGLVLAGSGVGTIKPVPWLLVTEVHVVGVEVESDHVPLGFQSLPHQVSPVVGVEGLEIL